MKKFLILVLITIFLSGCWLFPDINEVNVMGWVSPTGYNDPSSIWTQEPYAYDGSTDYGALGTVQYNTWSGFIELTHSGLWVNKMKHYSGGSTYDENPLISQVDIDIYYSGAWHHLYQGVFTYFTWYEKQLGSLQWVTKMRFRYFNNDHYLQLERLAYMTEAYFYQDTPVAPTVTTQSCSAVTGQTATGNGNITSIGTANATRRGFCYKLGDSGDPTVSDSTVYDDGSFGTGAYTKGITGLSPSTNYRVRAYAINPAGTSYGATVQLTTDSPPTVTTQSVSDILSTTATGNGNITATGGETPTRRGFCYMEGDSGDPTTANSVAYDDGSFGTGVYTKGLTGLSPGTTYRVRAYAVSSAGTGYGSTVQFTTDKVAPTVTTQAPTSILPTSITGNGNITALGGENAETRGFKWGLTQDDTWDAHDDGSFGAGAFTKAISSNLLANTTYWIRAYATNTVGTSYGEYVEFQTAAAGVIPTGTMIVICSDYTGYTYKAQRSETDDGDPYTAYFVINTDLANKAGLTYYKRILDLHLYFRCEASGTAEIYVKRDSEADFQYLGSVGLTDVAEPTIIVKHLAVDVRAKDYDFKVSFGNACRFLGVVYEFIPEGDR